MIRLLPFVLFVCGLYGVAKTLVILSSPQFMVQTIDPTALDVIDDSLKWDHPTTVYNFAKMLTYSPHFKYCNERHINRKKTKESVEALFSYKILHDALFSYERIAHNPGLAKIIFPTYHAVNYGAVISIDKNTGVWPQVLVIEKTLLTLLKSPNLVAKDGWMATLFLSYWANKVHILPELFFFASTRMLETYAPSLHIPHRLTFTVDTLIMLKKLLLTRYNTSLDVIDHPHIKLWAQNRRSSNWQQALSGWLHIIKFLHDIYQSSTDEVERKRCVFVIMDYLTDVARNRYIAFYLIENHLAYYLKAVDPDYIPAFKLVELYTAIVDTGITLTFWFKSHQLDGFFLEDHVLPWTLRSLEHRVHKFISTRAEFVDVQDSVISIVDGDLPKTAARIISGFWGDYDSLEYENVSVFLNLNLDRPFRYKSRVYRTPVEVIIRYSQQLRRNLFNGSKWRVPTDMNKIWELMKLIPFLIVHKVPISLPAFPQPKQWTTDVLDLSKVIRESLCRNIYRETTLRILSIRIAEIFIDGIEPLLTFFSYSEILHLLGNYYNVINV